MKFARFSQRGPPEWGVDAGDRIYRLSALPEGEPDLQTIATDSYRRRITDVVARDGLPSVDEDDVDRLAPVPVPGKLVCLGLNYFDHAAEQDEEPPERPLLFTKAPTSVTDPGRPIVLPSALEQVDYEVELAFVVGRTAYRVDAADAENYIAGYTIVNDVSGRDAQFADGQVFRGKSYDTFAPMGPVLVTGDEFDPSDAAVRLRVNGEVKQESTTAQLVHDVPTLVEYISHAMTLRPGDVVATGTPGGVGIFRDPPELLAPGDTVDAEVEGIGTLTNPVVAE